MNTYGYNIEITGKDKADKNVRTRFLKDDSIKKLVSLEHHSDTRKKIQIMVEVDINPPAGANLESEYIDFPIDFSILTHNMPSLLAGKCHALLCRKHVKGRDWYDFSWYVSKKTKVNLEMLKNAIYQSGPWKGQEIDVTSDWLLESLTSKINSLDWKDVREDVSRFLKPDKQESLQLWSKEFFNSKAKKFVALLNE